MILVIDNYDSFVFNLSRYIVEMGCETKVVRNDRLSVAEVADDRPQAIVLSPGPGQPASAGICMELVSRLGSRVPMLGVCLGHQAIAAALGGRIIRAPEPVHGRTSLVHHAGQGLFGDIPQPLRAVRYHSLMVQEDSLPRSLKVTARTSEGLVMAIEHRAWPLFGVQFHPESVLTAAGHRLLFNFLKLAGIDPSGCPTDDHVGPNVEAAAMGNVVSMLTTPHW